MRVLVIGSGAREHALLLALKADPSVEKLFVAPGNAGTAKLAEQHAVDVASGEAVTALAKKVEADLVVIGPEVPLVLGVADALREAGIAAFGPSADAARIEGSKAFAKDVMAAAGVRTAHSEIVDSPALLDAALDRFGPNWVVKDDGLAAGKGLVGGESGGPLRPAQDHKRVGDGDTGPNTGGMGAYTPLPWLPETAVEEIVRGVVKPVAAEMVQRGVPFSGLLYAGLAMGADGPAVVEFNCRFGDPETQAVLALLDSPLGEVLNATATGTLASLPQLRWKDGAAVTVVIAAENYPGRPRTGDEILGSEGAGVLHAGTAVKDGAVVSAGGRVLSVVGTGFDLTAARDDAYSRIAGIRLPGSHFRTDIGLAAVEGRISL